MTKLLQRLRDAWTFAKYAPHGRIAHEGWEIEDQDQFGRFMQSQTGRKLRRMMLDDEYVAMTAACRKHKGDPFAAGWAAGLQANNLFIEKLSAHLPPQTEKIAVEAEADGFDAERYQS